MGNGCTSPPVDNTPENQDDNPEISTTLPRSDIDNEYSLKDRATLIENFPLVPAINIMRDFDEQYLSLDSVGTGSTSAVLRMQDKHGDKRVYAVKKIARTHKSAVRGFRRESRILSTLNHNHIVGLHGLYIDEQHYYIAQELCTGGMILEKVQAGKQISERELIDITWQILTAVRYMHDHNVVHRDIKPDNIMYQSERRNRIVLIDFGQARMVRGDDTFKDWVGTPAYMAPETIHDRTGDGLKKVDMWAVGVTVFVMLTGCLPFYGENVKSLMKEVCQKRVTYPRDERTHVPLEARKFVSALLKRNVENRLTAEQALMHEWIEADRQRTTNAILKQWTDNWTSFENSTQLKKLVVDIALDELDEHTRLIMDAAFDLIDTGNDGSIDEEDIVEFLHHRGLTLDRAAHRGNIMFKVLGGGDDDEKDSNAIDKQAFGRAHMARDIASDEQRIREFFHRLDRDGDEQITIEEVQHTMSDFWDRTVSHDEAKQIVEEVDRNKDGVISFSEFQHAMRHLTIRMEKAPVMTMTEEKVDSERITSEDQP